MTTFYFTIIRAPYDVPLVIKREADSWDEVLAEFPDAVPAK